MAAGELSPGSVAHFERGDSVRASPTDRWLANPTCLEGPRAGGNNTAIVGGWDDNLNIGAAWVFTRSAGVWTQQGSKLVGSGAVGNPQQGVSVALSGDGNTAIVGAYEDNSRTGAAWVYTRSGGVWTQQGNKLVGGQYFRDDERGERPQGP